MIVKNEQAVLPQCLNSVKDIVDEMVVLDTGSTDRTPAIAREFGAKVYNFEWCHDFSVARNESLKYVQGDWILVLDADEMLVPEVAPMLKQAIQSQTHLLINLVRQEVGAEQSPYSMVSRLFRRHPDIRFSRPYHELVDESVAAIIKQESQWQVGYLPQVAILHTGYQAAAIAKRQKTQQAQTAMAAFLASHPHDSYVCSKLGALYVQTGHVQRGIELLEQGLKSDQGDGPVLYELHYHLGIAYSRFSKPEQAEAHYQAATQQPLPAILKLGAYNNWGNLLKAKGDLLGAKRLYEQVLGIEPTLAVGHYNLGMTLKALGEWPAAIAAYQQAIQLHPTYAEAYQNLGVVLLKTGNVAESLAAFRQAIALHEPQEATQLRQGLREIGFEL